MRRVAMLSFHTSPLVQPGVGDSGGMNVYVRELGASLAHVGVDTTVFTRTWREGLPRVIAVEPGFRLVHVDAGAPALAKEDLPQMVDTFADGVARYFVEHGPPDAIHANYWLSGVAGHRLKHDFDLPLVTTFHTFARVKAESGDLEPEAREAAEASVIGCADTIVVSCTEEANQFRRLYGDPPGSLEIVAPGVEHAFFAPGPQHGARRALSIGSNPVLLFVGRIQPLKGVDVAVRTLAELRRDDAELFIVGGASGQGGQAEVGHIEKMAAALGVADRVHFVEPQPHHMLSTWYRAADVVIVPSRSESFGLVALEAAASGIPVVASAVGGLRTLIDHGRTGFLVDSRDASIFAAHVRELLDNRRLASAMGMRAALRSRQYTWSQAASRLARVYEDLLAARLVQCS
jgi:D-inositol-3-phosphate glycosyltransferase